MKGTFAVATSTTDARVGVILPRPFLAAVLAALMSVAALLAGPSPSFAGTGDGSPLSCSYYPTSYHNSRAIYDPRNGRYVGTASLAYSSGCQSEWARIDFNPGYVPEISFWKQNQTGTDLYSAYNGSGLRYTYMYMNMRLQAGCGGVQLYAAADGWWQGHGAYLGWFYLGCY